MLSLLLDFYFVISIALTAREVEVGVFVFGMELKLVTHPLLLNVNVSEINLSNTKLKPHNKVITTDPNYRHNHGPSK